VLLGGGFDLWIPGRRPRAEVARPRLPHHDSFLQECR